MSTELRTVPTTDIQQTRFFGGKDRGTCIQLTREQAAALAIELTLFAEGNEVTEHLAQIESEFDAEAICEALCS